MLFNILLEKDSRQAGMTEFPQNHEESYIFSFELCISFNILVLAFDITLTSPPNKMHEH